MQFNQKRQAVAPVLATLLMIAVAVAMSVIIFMWSQGFLSQTSSATGGQQGAQNQAAQSSIAIELATFTTGSSGKITAIVRNVGAVAVTLGSTTVTSSSSNSGFTGSITSTLASSTWTTAASDTGATCWAQTGGTTSLSKGSSATLTLTRTSGSCTGSTTVLSSGDVINVKVTTTVGTFAQAQFTVP